MDRRRRTSVGITMLAGAAGLGFAAAVVPTAGVDTSAPVASAVSSPSTLRSAATDPIVAPPPSAAGDDRSPASAPATVTTTTIPLSPLASRVGPPVAVTPAPAAATAVPVRVRVDAIGVDHPVLPVGVDAGGALEVPDEDHVGWYRLGAAPGRPGSTVLLAHVNWHGVDGPFVALRHIEPGSMATVVLADGSTRTYEVVERQQYDKTGLPAERIWTDDGAETLVLITCGGDFDRAARRYRHNIVAYAVPVGAGP